MKNVKLSLLCILGLQSMMMQAQESKSPENENHMQEIPSYQNIIARNILINFNNKIDQDTPLSQDDLDGWIDYLINHQILFTNVINDDIHSQDNQTVIKKGDLLFKAIRKNNIHMVQLLLDAGADINIQTKEGNTPLHIAVNNTELVRMLIAAGTDINIKNNVGKTPLHWAALHERAEVARMLIKAGANVNIQDKYDNTPLRDAAAINSTEVARMLIDAGADLNIQDADGETAEQLAHTDEMRAIFAQARKK